MFESYQAVGGIKCKGTLYPGFTPRPTMCEILLEPPYAESGTEKTQMEMNLFTWSNLKIMDTEKKFKETALKTFAVSIYILCKFFFIYAVIQCERKYLNKICKK